eukprot:TRINITY_DN24565_c0_g1_i1.p1 TRINITY_DN24565_c0_g1~~TRINITY_DN24565_c0_g1_i1.p1  ORF type:complete len:893 (-),score=160.21 TRINITY_DN24565_c0_g1_i1:28-2706(-)
MSSSNQGNRDGLAMENRGEVNASNGLGNVTNLMATYDRQAKMAMVDSHKGVTNMHVPSDVIIDDSMPTAVGGVGKMRDISDVNRGRANSGDTSTTTTPTTQSRGDAEEDLEVPSDAIIDDSMPITIRGIGKKMDISDVNRSRANSGASTTPTTTQSRDISDAGSDLEEIMDEMPVPTSRFPTPPSSPEEDTLDRINLTISLADFRQKRQLLADWLVSYDASCDPAGLTAALTTMTGIVLDVASAVSLGYASSGGMSPSLSRERLLSLIDEDEKACASFQRQMSKVLGGACRADGGAFELMAASHMWELRGIEQWAQKWYHSISCGAGPISDISWFREAACGAAPRIYSHSERSVVQGLRQNFLDSLEQLQDLQSFLQDMDSGVVRGLAFGQLTELFPADAASDDVLASPFVMLDQSLDELIRARANFMVQLQELVSSSASHRTIAGSSKIVTTLGFTTGVTLLVCPAIYFPAIGILTLVTSVFGHSLVGEAEDTLHEAVMSKLQQHFNDDRAAGLAFDRRLRGLLQKQGQEKVPVHLLTLLGAWVSEVNQAPQQRTICEDTFAVLGEAVLDVALCLGPIDVAYSFATDSKTTRSLKQIYENVAASQHKLLDLQSRLRQTALRMAPPLPTGFEHTDFELVSMSGIVGNKQVSACLSWVLSEHGQGCRSRCDESLQKVLVNLQLHELEHTEALKEQSSETQSLAELVEDLMQKRQALLTQLDGRFSAIAASGSSLAEGGDIVCWLGAFAGVLVCFVPGGAAIPVGLGMCSNFFWASWALVGSQTLVIATRARQLQYHIAEDRAAQMRVDKRLQQMLRTKPEDSGAGIATDVMKTWLWQHSSNLTHFQQYRGSMGDDPRAALPLQSEDSALIFRDELTTSLDDLQMLRQSLQALS